MRMRAITVFAVVITCVLGLAATASAGQIIYVHGQDLWAMNDDGSGQHPLVTGAQIGGTIGDESGGDDTGVSVQPGGTAIAFSGDAAPTGVMCALNCPGLYSYVNGKLLRLSDPGGACGGGATTCGSEQTDPQVLSTGRVLYYSLFASNTFTGCDYDYCGTAGNYQETYLTRAIDGSDSPTVWPLPAAANPNTGTDPGFEGPIAADPADPTKMAYGGDYDHTYNPVSNTACGPTGASNCYPLDVESTASSTPAVNQLGIDDSFYHGLSFSADGTRLADIETGDNKGIWVYSSTQNYKATTPAPQFTFALSDPDNVSGAGEFDHVISDVTFVNNNEIVFSANNNLWSIPSSCWATPTGTSPTANCTFPASAHQLTTDGNSTTPDSQPAWTSSTAAIPTYSPAPATTTGSGGTSTSGGGSSGSGGTSTTTTRTTPATSPAPSVTLTKVSQTAHTVAPGRSLVVHATLSAAATISGTVLRYVPASGTGHHRHKAHYVTVGTFTVRGKRGSNTIKVAKVHGHALGVGSYELRLTVGHHSKTLMFKVKR